MANHFFLAWLTIGLPVVTSTSVPGLGLEADFADAALGFAKSVVRIDAVRPGNDGMPGSRPTVILQDSGFVLDQHGHIASAAHVVQNASTISVVTASGHRFPARLVGLSKDVDLAILAVTGVLPNALTIASTLPGHLTRIVSVGAPFCLEGSISFGHVTGHPRSDRVSDPVIFLQHDASIKFGSSGGPVVDQQGQVIGMNASLPPGQHAFVGIAFALEGSLLAEITQDLIERGTSPHIQLGGTFRDLSDVAWRLDYDAATTGLLITDIVTDGSLAEADVRPGALLVSVDGYSVSSLSDLLRVFVDKRHAKALTLGIKDAPDDEIDLISVTPATLEIRSDPSKKVLPNIGMSLLDDECGVKIGFVRDCSLAAASGLKLGDRVIAVDLSSNWSAFEAQDLMRSSPIATKQVIRNEYSPRLITPGDDMIASGRIGANSIGRNAIIR